MNGSHASAVLRSAPGLAVLVVALLAPPLRRADGSIGPDGWAIAVGGLALVLVAALWHTRWQRCAALLALAVVGQACALQLINAPPYGVYQRFFPWHDLLAPGRLPFVLALVAQTTLVIGAAHSLWPSMARGLRSLLATRHLVALGLVTLATSVLVSRDPAQYALEVVLIVWLYPVSALNLVLVAAAVPVRTIENARAWRVLPARWDRRLPWLAAAWTTSICAAIAWFVMDGVPHIPDSVSYYVQAKYLSVGHLYLPAPPDAASFEISHLFNDGTKWFGYGFVGWPAVLSIGMVLGVPWLVNPVLAGVVVLLSHAIISRLSDRITAHAVVLLLSVSPWFLFVSSSFMAHTATLVWALAALCAVAKERQSGRSLWGLAAGGFLGALFLTRPIEGVLVGGAVGLWALGIGGQRLKIRALAGLAGASILVGGVMFPYNHALTGDAFYAPQLKWADEKAFYPGGDRLGFGPELGNVGWPHLDPFPGHGLRDVIANVHMNSYSSNFELFGWGFGSFVFVVLAVTLGGLRRGDGIFVGIAAAIVLGHSFYWSNGGPDFGARYWSQMLIPLVFLTVRGVQVVQIRLRECGARDETLWRVAAFVVAASLVAFVNVVPWRSVGKYHRYRGMSADVVRIAKVHGFGDNALVFVQDRDKSDYASAIIFNPPTLESPGTIYVRDAGPAHRRIVLRHFPDRPVWFLGGSSEEEVRLRVLAGPLDSKGAEVFE